jgi:hypothetical protein
MIEFAHSIPGRLRIVVRVRRMAPQVRTEILAIRGVTGASLNETTGSIVITHDTGEITVAELTTQLNERFPTTAAASTVPAIPDRERKAIGLDGLVLTIADACLRYVAERSAAALLAALI